MLLATKVPQIGCCPKRAIVNLKEGLWHIPSIKAFLPPTAFSPDFDSSVWLYPSLTVILRRSSLAPLAVESSFVLIFLIHIQSKQVPYFLIQATNISH